MFTRQFADYFHLWDAVIVSKFTLVDYIVVAMVLAVRSLLIKGDSNCCNTVLVSKYPSNVCPHYIIRLALHLQDSKAFHKPTTSPFLSDDGGFEFVVQEEVISQQKHPRHCKQTADINSRLRWNFERVQHALNQANEAVEASKCDHGLVQVSLIHLQTALDKMGQELPDAAQPPNRHVRKHKRNTSVAYEALAFE